MEHTLQGYIGLKKTPQSKERWRHTFIRRTGGDVLPWPLFRHVKNVAYAMSLFLVSTPIYFGHCWPLPSIPQSAQSFPTHCNLQTLSCPLVQDRNIYIYINHIFRFPLEPIGGPCVGRVSQPWRFWTTSFPAHTAGAAVFSLHLGVSSQYERPAL